MARDTIHIEDILVEGNKYIRLEVYYSLGGMNYFNYKEDPRGYFASAKPVELEDGLVSFNLFSGTKTLLYPCRRKSDKAATDAMKRFPEVKEALLSHVRGKEAKKSARLAIEKELGISIPPFFDGKTKEEIQMLQVTIITENGNRYYPTLTEAMQKETFKGLCGAMRDSVNGRDCLRFESQEVSRVLSA